MKAYLLMHKNDECGVIFIDEDTGNFMDYKDYESGFAPFFGNANKNNMKKWWEMRAVPAAREDIVALINGLSLTTSEEYLAKNLAISVTDTYWIKPIDDRLEFKDVNFWNFKNYHGGKLPYHNVTSYDPNASLGGQMEKCWDLSGEVPVLRKEAYKSYGQQAINELFATELHQRQKTRIPYVSYRIERTENGGVVSLCDSFTNLDKELITAYEVLESGKKDNSDNNYSAYITICSKHGIDKDIMQDYLDYQTLTDFVISNTDEHLGNFGILRDANTMNLLGPAPIYDSGNSMFYSDILTRPFSRVELLKREITSFYKTEDKMLRNVKNKKIVHIDLLPTKEYVADFYKENGVPENRADVISDNYEQKLALLNEFQNGKTISLYLEKRKDYTNK
nr:hypothetical protein [uncultured Butyrivibrio sp.]